MIQLPGTSPKDDPRMLWSLQLELLALAESHLGPRDASKKIYQPQFGDHYPQVRHTPNEDGAFAELSRYGKQYWPTVVNELAHETIHLLNPVKLGEASNLEEGVAVAFSIKAQHSYGIQLVQVPTPESEPSYMRVRELVHRLPDDPITSAKLIRERFGSFSAVTAEGLAELFPKIDGQVLWELGAKFVRAAPLPKPLL